MKEDIEFVEFGKNLYEAAKGLDKAIGGREEMNKIKLGDKAKDKISGFEGIVTAEIKFLNGCDRLQVTPDKLNTDGSLIEGEYFDRPQLKKIPKKRIKLIEKKDSPGGDRPVPKMHKLP